jgi:hypothetical protein
LYYRYLWENYTDAPARLWAAWNNPSNESSEKFTSVQALIFNLVTYKDKNAIGTLTIDADSVPIYYTWYNWFNSVEVWECADWQQWYQKNLTKYGSGWAQQKFVDAWRSSDNFSIGFWGDGMGWTCGRDCDFINYFRVKGIDVTVWGAQTVCNLVSIPYNLIDATASITRGAKHTADVTATLLPLAAGAAIIYFISRQSKK